MRIIALLSFFDESPELLRESISRVRALGADVLIAVDGPYDLYPAEDQISSFETVKAVLDCATDDMSLILRAKTGWSGNEVEKRNHMLDLALEVAEEGDWLLVLDADHMWEMIEPETGTLKQWLETTFYDAAQVGIADCALDAEDPSWYEARLLLRAVPGMRYDGAHWRVRFPDGGTVSTLRAGDERGRKGLLDLTSVARVRHVVHQQPPARRERMAAYYDGRDFGEGIEA